MMTLLPAERTLVNIGADGPWQSKAACATVGYNDIVTARSPWPRIIIITRDVAALYPGSGKSRRHDMAPGLANLVLGDIVSKTVQCHDICKT